MTVTPGYLPADGSPVTTAQLRQIASPTVALDDGEVTADKLDIADVAAALGSDADKPNYFSNGNFAPELWDSPYPQLSVTGVDTVLAHGWWTQPGAGSVTAARSTTVTTIATNQDDKKSLYSMEITGSASATGVVQIGQNILRSLSASLRQGVFALSFHVYNGTGGGTAGATVEFYTANAADDFSAVTSVHSENCGSIANGQWTKVTLSNLDASAWANLTNGLRVAIQFPAAFLNTGGKLVRICQAKMELAGATAFVVTPVQALAPGPNLFFNPNFREGLWSATTISAPAALDTELARGWFANPTGHAITYAQDSFLDFLNSKYVVQLTGATGCTDLKWGQNIPRRTSPQLRRLLTFSIWLQNGTGGTITPTLRIDTTSVIDDFSAANLTNQLDVTLGACAAGQWTRLTRTFDGNILANAENGIRLSVHLASGLSAGQTIYLALPKLEVGTEATPWQPEPLDVTPAGNPARWRNLICKDTSGTNPTRVSADELLVFDAAGNAVMLSDVDLFSNITDYLDAGAPANTTCYYLFVIWNGTTSRLLFSTSATAPTMPAGYTHKVLVSAVFTNGSAQIVNFRQQDDVCWIESTQAYAGANAAAYTALSLAAIVPPSAREVFGLVGTTSTGENGIFALSPDGVPYPPERIISVSGTSSTIAPWYGVREFSLIINDTTIYWKSTGTGSNKRIDITGYRL